VNWQLAIAVLGTTFAAISVGFNIYQYRRNRRYKELTYIPLSNFSVLQVLEQYQQSLSIRYREPVEERKKPGRKVEPPVKRRMAWAWPLWTGNVRLGSTYEREVTNIHAIEMRLQNTGTEPIELPGHLDENQRVGATLEEAVRLDFGNTEIISAKVSATTPEGKTASVSREPVADNGLVREVVELQPVMLNPTESLSILTLLAEKPADEPKVLATIEGTKVQKRLPQEVQSAQALSQMRRMTQWMTGVAVVFSLVVIAFSLTREPSTILDPFASLVSILPTALLIYVILINYFFGRIESRRASRGRSQQ
jgi:hypothetical protein